MLKKLVITICALCVSSVGLRHSFATDDTQPLPPRFANGIEIEGTVEDVTDEGISIKDAKGLTTTYPWKHLSAGTRYRYEKILQEKKAKLKAEEEKKKHSANKEAKKEAKKEPSNSSVSTNTTPSK